MAKNNSHPTQDSQKAATERKRNRKKSKLQELGEEAKKLGISVIELVQRKWEQVALLRKITIEPPDWMLPEWVKKKRDTKSSWW